MFLPKIAQSFVFSLATLASTYSIVPHTIPLQDAPASSRLDSRARPDQTIGEFFDTLPFPHQTPLRSRHLVRTNTLTEAIWTDSQCTYNISMSRCLTMSDIAGIYTLQNGTTQHKRDPPRHHRRPANPRRQRSGQPTRLRLPSAGERPAGHRCG